jgi:hypothetical protein
VVDARNVVLVANRVFAPELVEERASARSRREAPQDFGPDGHGTGALRALDGLKPVPPLDLAKNTIAEARRQSFDDRTLIRPSATFSRSPGRRTSKWGCREEPEESPPQQSR